MAKSPPKSESQKASQTIHKVPDGGWGWVIVFGSFMISLLGDGFSYTSGIFYENFLKVYGQNESITSMFTSIMTGMIYCAGPFASGLTYAYGCRNVAIAGSVITVVGMLGSIIFDSIYVHCITLGLITGTGLGLLYLAQIIIVTYWFDKRLSFATGIAVCGSGIGIAIFAVLSEWLINTFGWKGAMLLLSAIMFTCVAYSALFRKVDFVEESSDWMSALKETINFKILTDVVFLYFTFANFIASLVYYVPIIWMKDRIIKLGIGDGNDAVRMLVYFGLTNACGRAIFGFFADNKSLNRQLLYSSTIIIFGITIGLTTFANNSFNLMAFFIILYGAAEGAYVCLSPVVLVDLFGKDKVMNAFGILSLFEGIASTIGPPLIGMTAKESYEPGILISAFITIFAGILLLFLPLIQRKYSNNNYSHIN